jgi:hypothetical protein
VLCCVCLCLHNIFNFMGSNVCAVNWSYDCIYVLVDPWAFFCFGWWSSSSPFFFGQWFLKKMSSCPVMIFSRLLFSIVPCILFSAFSTATTTIGFLDGVLFGLGVVTQ